MIQPMIREVQALHKKVYGKRLTRRQIKSAYECTLSKENLKSIKEHLLKLHSEIMFLKIGSFNPNDI